MAFKMVLDSIDDLPEDIAKEYVEKDGKFHIQVEGMKTQADVDKLNTSLNAERTEHNALKEKIKVFGDEKFEDIRSKLDRIPELEAAAEGKLDDEKIAELADKRAAAKIVPIERERDALKLTNEELTGKVQTFETKEKTRSIHDQVRSAAKEAGLIDEAVEDALLLADRTFELGEDGMAVVKDDSGFSAGLQPKDWMADLQEKRPHWWGPSAGGGAGGNRQGGGASKNPWSAEHWNMTEQGKIITQSRTRAEQLATAAGTTIGGAKPEPKK